MITTDEKISEKDIKLKDSELYRLELESQKRPQENIFDPEIRVPFPGKDQHLVSKLKLMSRSVQSFKLDDQRHLEDLQNNLQQYDIMLKQQERQ